MNTVDVLIAARKLIEKPENWCRETYETDSGAYCAVGAISRAAVPDGDYGHALNVLEDVVGHGNIEVWNDAHTHAEVLAAFDAAIAAERAKESA